MLTETTDIPELTHDLGRLLGDAETCADRLAAVTVPKDVKTLAPELRAVLDLKEKAAAIGRALGVRRDLIERELIAFHEQTEIDSIRNKEFGITISFKDAMRPKVDPERWKEVFDWVFRHGQYHILTKKLCNAKTMELMNGDTGLPPGVDVESYTEVNVRRV